MNNHQKLITLIQNKPIYAVLREISNNGNTRCIDFLVIVDDKPLSISALMSPVLNLKLSTKRFGLVVNGCGMDMAFSCLYRLFGSLGLNTSDVEYSLI